jgi:hypothetical protein
MHAQRRAAERVPDGFGSRGSAPPLFPIHAWGPVGALIGVRTVKPRPRDIAQHADKTSAAPDIRVRPLDLRGRAPRPLDTPLRVNDGREQNDPCRQRGEDQFPHDHSPKYTSTPLH